MLKIRRPLGRLIFNMGIAIPGKTVFLIETAPWSLLDKKQSIWWLDQNDDGDCENVSTKLTDLYRCVEKHSVAVCVEVSAAILCFDRPIFKLPASQSHRRNRSHVWQGNLIWTATTCPYSNCTMDWVDTNSVNIGPNMDTTISLLVIIYASGAI